MKKIYVGCAITNIPEKKDFASSIAELKNELRKAGFEILEFMSVLKEKPTYEEIYIHDIRNSIEHADAMLAILDHPSTGMGYELATAIEKCGIPVLVVANEESSPSRLIMGIQHPKFKFMRYKNFNDISKIFINFVSSKL